MKQRVSIQGEHGEIGVIEGSVSPGDNIVDLIMWTADGGGSTSLRLDVAETLELIGKLTKCVTEAVKNS